jgi:hypothetical protein
MYRKFGVCGAQKNCPNRGKKISPQFLHSYRPMCLIIPTKTQMDNTNATTPNAIMPNPTQNPLTQKMVQSSHMVNTQIPPTKNNTHNQIFALSLIS